MDLDFHLGAHVRGRDGVTLGSLGGVVYNPETGQVVSLVVRHRGVGGQSLVVPIGAVASSHGNETQVELSSEQFNTMPPFEITQNLAPPPTADRLELEQNIAPENVPDEPPVGAATGIESIAFMPILQENFDVPAGDDPILRHTTVYATDGEVGNVSDILVDPQTNRVTGFIVGEGLIFTHHVQVPMSDVTSFEPGCITLGVLANALQKV